MSDRINRTRMLSQFVSGFFAWSSSASEFLACCQHCSCCCYCCCCGTLLSVLSCYAFSLGISVSSHTRIHTHTNTHTHTHTLTHSQTHSLTHSHTHTHTHTHTLPSRCGGQCAAFPGCLGRRKARLTESQPSAWTGGRCEGLWVTSRGRETMWVMRWCDMTWVTRWYETMWLCGE